MAANWSEIPEELVYLVAERVVSVDDFVRFGAVCKPWRSVSIVKKERQAFAPLVMLAKADNDDLPPTTTSDDYDEGKGIRSFIIPYGGQQDTMRSFDLELPKTQGRRCWGSPLGWLVTIGLDFSIHFLNPLTRVQIPLPPQPNLQQQSNLALCEDLTPSHIIRVFTRKFVVGWNPSSSSSSQEFIVMAIFGQESEVAFITCPNGIEACCTSSSWTRIESDLKFIVDVISFQGRIFMIDKCARLSVCDINQTPPTAIQIASAPEEYWEVGDRFYLVDLAGCLHLVIRIFKCVGPGWDLRYQTTCFLVYRFNFHENKWCVVEEELGEYALFVGNHTSFSISTTTYPEFSSNCIYFSDDHFSGYDSRHCDMGVYDYEEGTIEEFDFTSHGAFSKFSRPIFFIPSL